MKYLCAGFLIFDCLALLALCARPQAPTAAQGQGNESEVVVQAKRTEQPSGEPVAATRPVGGIQWFATWEAGLREAQRTGQPILLVAATPHCGGVSGMW
jgi:hypothetical protein